MEMRKATRWFVGVAGIITAMTLGRCLADESATEPFFESQLIYEGQRFVSVVVAMDGTVLAFRGQGGPVQVRRSEDGGKTWGPIIEVGGGTALAGPGFAPGLMGAAVVDKKSGDVLAFQGFSMFRSSDTGRTWAEQKVEVKPDGFGGLGDTHGADSGITLRFGEHKGRLLMPARVTPPGMNNDLPWRPYLYNSAIFSDDGGKTWQTSHPFPVLGTGEGALAELSDGRVYYNSRSHMATDALRRVAWSHDGGLTWNNPETSTVLPDGIRGNNYGCAGGLTRLDVDGADVLVYSNIDSASGRQDLTVWATLDGAKTWPVKRLVHGGPAAYSSLAAGRPGTPSEGLVFVLFEGGEKHRYEGIRLARFNLAWLLNGTPTGDGQLPE